MAAPSRLPPLSVADVALAARLERGDLLYLPACPFPLPQGADRQFLFAQRQNRAHKNVSYNPLSDKLVGFWHQSPEDTEKLRFLLRTFGNEAARWLAQVLPAYAQAWQRDRVTLRPEEEATRRLRHSARNDLMHVDAFPTRPTGGARILRLFVNIHRDDPRVWVTSESFAQLLVRFAHELRLPDIDDDRGPEHLGQKLLRLVRPHRHPRSAYDAFMLRFHHFLKMNDRYQERCPKRFWHFLPNSLWLAFTDTLSHAELRGQFALEHSFFVPLSSLALPEEAPIALLEQACRAARRCAA
jgi:hypothetical protein